MARYDWQFALNTFASVTEGSFRLMNIISTDHNARLYANQNRTGIYPLYQAFNSKYEAFARLYSRWIAERANYISATQAFTDLLSKLVVSQLERWESQVILVYPSRSPGYLRLLSNGRVPFYRSAYDQRISLVEALSNNLQSERQLVMLKLEVDDFLLELRDARQRQQGYESSVRTLRADLENSRLELAAAMYYSLGGLMMIHCQNPILVEDYFDLENIRSVNNTSDEEETTPALTLRMIPGQTVESGLLLSIATRLMLVNTGTVAVRVYASLNPGTVGTGGRVLQPGESFTGNITTLGWNEGEVLCFTNESTDGNAVVEVTLL